MLKPSDLPVGTIIDNITTGLYQGPWEKTQAGVWTQLDEDRDYVFDPEVPEELKKRGWYNINASRPRSDELFKDFKILQVPYEAFVTMAEAYARLSNLINTVAVPKEELVDIFLKHIATTKE